MTTADGMSLMNLVSELQDRKRFQDLNWTGNFQDYLDLVARNPRVARNAFQRVYDMIMSYGNEEFIDAKKKLIRYNFFSDPSFDQNDMIFGLEIPLMRLVNFFKAAAQGYGTERRVLLLHGPVGSSKSTIVRRLKRGLEEYSRREDGALYTFDWYMGDAEDIEQGRVKDADWEACPMHEEPLHLIPVEMRERFCEAFNADRPEDQHVHISGDLDPACRFNYRELMRRYNGDWSQAIRHIRVRRLVFSEQDRVGIGTFQPKDEKNQDSTELTGDINYRKIAIYGSDSDPRAFDFNGEFNVANRGICEFIEMLKLDVAFLYDLLGASQEHRIKSKKFAQTDIDEVIIGHSVSGDTPIPYRHEGVIGWTTHEQLYERFINNPAGLEVLSYDFEAQRTRWTPVKALFRHRFEGEMLTTSQKWGVVETTPNHSIYDRQGQTFYPEERREVMAIRHVDRIFADAVATLAEDEIARMVQDSWREQRPFPDALFNQPTHLLRHAFGVLRKFTAAKTDVASGSNPLASIVHNGVRALRHMLPESFFTGSPLLASQIGLLASAADQAYVTLRSEHGYSLLLTDSTTQREMQLENRLTARMARDDEWVYDIECIGLHNFVSGVGNVVCSNTNEPEYRKLQNNEFMEALKDRTVRIDVPYITRLRDEIRIYEKDFGRGRVRGKHIAPHTIEMAAMWAVLTRLEEPKKANLTLLQKLKLYNGKSLPGFTEDNIKELRKETVREGMEGVSPRYIQDKISNALVNDQGEGCVNPFMVLNELESGLKSHALITNEEDRRRFRDLLAIVKEEYAEIVKNEVQRAISADEEAISRLASNYIDNVKAYTQRERVRNKYTGEYEEPDERLMRSIEEKIDIPDSRKDDFRREIMNYIGALAIEGKKFEYSTNERLHRALELKLFEDQKDSIKLTSLVSRVIDKDTQEKIDVVKARLIRDYGYCEICATDVLNYVASIFARGDVREGR